MTDEQLEKIHKMSYGDEDMQRLALTLFNKLDTLWTKNPLVVSSHIAYIHALRARIRVTKNRREYDKRENK